MPPVGLVGRGHLALTCRMLGIALRLSSLMKKKITITFLRHMHRVNFNHERIRSVAERSFHQKPSSLNLVEDIVYRVFCSKLLHSSSGPSAQFSLLRFLSTQLRKPPHGISSIVF